MTTPDGHEDQTDPIPTGPGQIGLDEAYAVDGPEGSRRLYAAWASTYDADFVEATGYIYHQRVADAFCQGFTSSTGPVLDVGCGTGVVGQELRRLGVGTVDGIDISPEMLDQARSRVGSDGRPVYRRLIEADLTTRIDLAANAYSGIVSAGTFTHGHLGPEALSELFRVAAPGARCAIGVNSAHFEGLGFRAALDLYRDEGRIGPYAVASAPIYRRASGHAPDDVANVVVATVN